MAPYRTSTSLRACAAPALILPIPADAGTERHLFACLVDKIEEMFATGHAPYPVERTLIVSGMLEGCLTSKLRE